MGLFCLVSIACSDLERNILFNDLTDRKSKYCSEGEYRFIGSCRDEAFSFPHDSRYLFVTSEIDLNYLKNLLLLGINDSFIHSARITKVAQIPESLKPQIIAYMRSSIDKGQAIV